MTAIYLTHSSLNLHYLPGHDHPERPERIENVWQHIQEANLPDILSSEIVQPIDASLIKRVHTSEHADTLQWIAGQDRVAMFDSDTYALPASYDIARYAAGACVQAVDSILGGRATSGLAAVRPPGHHATQDRAMGFCLLNNIALAAQYALDHFRLKRVLIVDIDVHHGNGTQDIFYDRDDVFFISMHQYPFYPGTGDYQEIGVGAGEGRTLNIPLPGGTGDSQYEQILETVVAPAAQRYEPEIILVSAGFDAHWRDPLAGMLLSLRGYGRITQQLIDLATQLCDGRIVFVMEGGYDTEVLGHGMANIGRLLAGQTDIADPIGPARRPGQDIDDVLTRIRQTHQLP